MHSSDAATMWHSRSVASAVASQKESEYPRAMALQALQVYQQLKKIHEFVTPKSMMLDISVYFCASEVVFPKAWAQDPKLLTMS